MVQNCNKITNEVIFFIKQLIYGFINAQRFYIVNFLNSLWLRGTESSCKRLDPAPVIKKANYSLNHVL